MSDYPRAEVPPMPVEPLVYDRVFAVIRVLATLYASIAHFLAFHAYWERVAPDRSIFAWAPPLGSHLTTQVAGVAIGVYASAALWNGRGWAFLYTLIASLGACALTLIVRSSALGLVLFVAVHVPSFLYCGLRLIGTLGPPTGGLELRRRSGVR